MKVMLQIKISNLLVSKGYIMKLFKALFCALSLSVSAATVHAEGIDPKFYAGIDLMATDVNPNGGTDYTLGSIGVKFGADLHEYFGLEARAGTGVIDDDENVLGTENNFDLNYYVAGFAKVQTPVSYGFRGYALLGAAQVEIENSSPGFSSKSDDLDLAFGFGASYELNQDFDVNLEYLSLNQDFDAINLGLTYRF